MIARTHSPQERGERSADALSLLVLLVAAIWLTRAVWSRSGVINFVDYNLPLSAAGATSSLRQSLSPWAGSRGLGSPNVGFLGTTAFLTIFKALSLPLGVATASRVLLPLLVWLDAIAMYAVLRRSFDAPAVAALVGGLVYVFNPWTFDHISQGHLYTLEVLAVAPFLVLAVPRIRTLSWRGVALIAVAVAFAVGADYHYGLLIVGFLGLDLLWRLRLGERSLVMRVSIALVLGITLLSIFTVPFVHSLFEIRTNNAPPIGDLLDFSNYTSWKSALSLLRPKLNASDRLSTYGATFLAAWAIAFFLAFSNVWITVIGRSWTGISGSPTLPLMCVAAIPIANGANGWTKGATLWFFTHVPFAGIFRDPSKILIFPLLLYLPALASVSKGAIRELIQDTRVQPATHEFVQRGAVGRLLKRLAQRVGPNPSTLGRYWRAIFILVLLVPLVLGGVATVGSTPGDLDLALPEQTGRLAYLPPWQYVRYPGNTSPVSDPLQLYSTTGAAGIGPDYDESKGNLFLRWLYSELYSSRSDTFYDLAHLAGVSAVVDRPTVEPVAGLGTTQLLFDKRNLQVAKRIQRWHPNFSGPADARVGGVGRSRVLSASSSLIRISGTNLGALTELADVTQMEGPAFCFEPECPDAEGLEIGMLNDLGIERDQPHPIHVATVAIGNPYPEGAWISPQVSYGEAGGAVTGQLVDIAVGSNNAMGEMSIARLRDRGRYTLWLQVLRGPTPITYSVSCGSETVSTSPPPTLGGYVWTWQSLGSLHLTAKPRCNANMKSKLTDAAGRSLGAIAGGFATSKSTISLHTPDVIVAPAATASYWTRTRPVSHQIRNQQVLQQSQTLVTQGMTSTSAVLFPRGQLTYTVPTNLPGRHLYARVVGIEGNAQVSARYFRSHRNDNALGELKEYAAREGNDTTGRLSGDPDFGQDPIAPELSPARTVGSGRSYWVDLGPVPKNSGRIDLAVSGGTIGVVRILMASPPALRLLRAAAHSALPVLVTGNARLVGSGPARVTIDGKGPAYLIVRADAGSLWSLDGKQPDGVYAGYGQIYEVKNGGALRTSLGRFLVFGGLLSGAAALLLVFLCIRMRDRERREPPSSVYARAAVSE